LYERNKEGNGKEKNIKRECMKEKIARGRRKRSQGGKRNKTWRESR
jgi:hypothetical protein